MAATQLRAPKDITQLPDEVRDFLLSVDAVDQAAEIAAKHQLPVWASDMLLNLAEDVTRGVYGIENLPEVIKATFEIDDRSASTVAIDLAGARLLPISALVGDVAGQIMAWGGDLKKFQSTPSVEIQALSAQQFVKDTLASMKLSLPNPNLQSRLEYVMTAFVKGVRDGEETKAVLMRSEKVGGLALDDEAAEHIVSVFEEKRGFVKVDFVAPVMAVPSVIASPANGGTKQSSSGGAGSASGGKIASSASGLLAMTKPGVNAPTPDRPFFEEYPEEQEKKVVKTIGQDVFGKEDAEDIGRYVASPMTNLGGAAERVRKGAELTFSSQDLEKRFSLAVEARLRDVRDAYETQALFESPIDKGGLALSGAELSRVMEALERVVSEWQAQMQAQLPSKESVILSEAKDLRQDSSSPVAPQNEKKAKVPASLPVTPRFSPASMTTAPGPKPKVEDVKFAPRLAGPIEELHRLSLIEFRRLSKDPHESAMKIKDKIDLLEEQGYEKKIQGIKAWRESPLNELYLSLSRDALVSGTSIARVAEERHATGQEMLTAPEIKAVSELNAELRF